MEILLFLAVPRWSMQFWAWLLIFLGILLVGAVVGFLVSRKLFKKYLKDNPPINEKMIREMYRQMGVTPSEKKIKQVMKAIEESNR